ncbi:hypothetical protein IB260_13300 [Pseudomonas sp. PDM23]|uniref:hypothetical protein n=1 Tax=unclassified Pseudomonas TaxID=196821 RepID=UPI0017822CFE|nr:MULTISPECIES: hypothetical protein [unclassified Pseudomonas]MBD9501316.1 hypothetical protein [Pseudomonas sp. PDM17]MBD9576289.1 hypothetical protein [Pseudomonas sp. PDM23]MBD9670216.1 hypothetical protein [Pseudomonas sp. PDM21]
MVDLDLTQAANLIGSYVLVETICDSEAIPEQYCMQFVGVVPPLAGVIEHPYFLVMDLLVPSKFPEELFWHNIQSLMVLGSKTASAHGELLPEEGIMIC